MGKIYVNSNQILVRNMIEIYKPDGIDWMSYQITKNNKLTFHHIKEASRGGETSIENGALVTIKGHRILNIIEAKDFLLYKDWNELFEQINKANKPLDNYYKEQSRSLKEYTQKILYKHL